MVGSEAAVAGHEVRVAAATAAAGAAETASIRLVALLPVGWGCHQRIEDGHIVLRVLAPGDRGADAVADWLAGALADRALAHWEALAPGG
ncbi:hypothetical protein ACWD6I_21250 [Streptomyces sp. NPDC002454]|uniref:hypothetical protein n=1 Tax=Streptomyces sp. NPDC002490 TaxID=3154416 RepID=UPI0033186567